METLILPNAEKKTAVEGDKGTLTVNPRQVTIRRHDWGSRYASLSDLPLPFEIDRHPWSLDDDLKWMMLRDPQVFAGYMLWKTGILVDGVQVYPSKNTKDSNGKPSKTRQKKADEIAEMCLWTLNNIKGGFHQKCLQILDCCVWGHKAAELEWDDQTYGRWKGKLVLKKLRMLSNDSYKVRTDKVSGEAVGLQSVLESGDDKIIPMAKFAYAVFRPYDDHPLGTNILWPAYTSWYEKQQIAPERLANMAQFGSPSLYATAPEGVQDIEMVDHNGLPIKYPSDHPRAGQTVRIPIQTQMLDSLQNFQGNGSVTVVPFSSEIKMLQAQGDGLVFRSYSDDKNMEITKAMFFTTSWTEQEKYGSNAKGKVGASIGHYSLMDGKNLLAEICEETICRNVILYNFGEEFLDLLPTVTFGNLEAGTMSNLFNAIAALWSTGFLDDSQRAALCEKMNLPLPDPNAPRPPAGQPTGNVLVNNKKTQEDESDEDEE